MKVYFIDEPGHRGYCLKHGKYKCPTCLRAQAADEARENDYGVFEWRSDGRYTRGTALRIFGKRALANEFAERHPGNVVVRSVAKERRR